jgi:hypothetical protein
MALWAVVALGMSRMDVLGLAKLAPPGDGGVLSLSGHFFTDTYTYRGYACPR